MSDQFIKDTQHLLNLLGANPKLSEDNVADIGGPTRTALAKQIAKLSPTPVTPPAPSQTADAVALKQNQKLADAGLAEAKSFLGVKEATGNNDGPQVNVFQEFVGGKGEDGAPWCACFYSYSNWMGGAKVGITPITPKSDSSSELYAWAKLHGYLLKAPIPGCLGLLRGDGGTAGKTHHHTFRVISVDSNAGLVHTIDGNEGNQVEYATHSISGADFAVCV